MRVATRRMRAAWLVFDGAYRPRIARRYVRELRGVARALGDVRDLDVLLKGLDAYSDSLPEAGGEALEPLRNAWREERERARQRLITLLDSRAYDDFVEDYLELTETAGAGARATPSDPGEPVLVRDTAGSRILGAYEHVRSYETVMGWADITTLHALRIAGKRLRYTLEYFAEVLPVSSRALDHGRHGDAGPPRAHERRPRGRDPDTGLAERPRRGGAQRRPARRSGSTWRAARTRPSAAGGPSGRSGDGWRGRRSGAPSAPSSRRSARTALRRDRRRRSTVGAAVGSRWSAWRSFAWSGRRSLAWSSGSGSSRACAPCPAWSPDGAGASPRAQARSSAPRPWPGLPGPRRRGSRAHRHAPGHGRA